MEVSYFRGDRCALCVGALCALSKRFLIQQDKSSRAVEVRLACR